MFRPPALLAAALATLLVACAGMPLTPGQTGEAEIRAHFGQPTMEWKHSDGSSTLEYPHGPAGSTTEMVTLNPNHTLRGIEQVLSDPYFAQVKAGMSQEQVRRLLGRPGSIRPPYADKGAEWKWRIDDVLRFEEWYFFVDFDRDGKVISSEKLRMIRGGVRHHR
jgi:hypothetical protein